MTQGNIYMDFNATTPVHTSVQERLKDWVQLWGNPSSIHQDGRLAKQLLRESRRSMAKKLGCHPLELIFTSGGSEANNLAVKGLLAGLKERAPHKTKIIMGAIEHPSVLKQAPVLEQLGYTVTKIPVSREGDYDMDFYEQHLDEQVALVSVMLANNEVGVLAPIAEMVKKAHQVGAFFHSDMVQVLGKVHIPMMELGVDLATFSSHKVYALKGAGLVYSRKGTPLLTQIQGGGQERGRRAGTENLLAIASFAHMLETLEPMALAEKVGPLRDQMERSIAERVDGVTFLCQSQSRLPNTSSFFISGVSGESLLMNLDIRGFSVGTGAACSSGNPEPSPVLLAMGLTRAEAQSSLRISLGLTTTEDGVQSFVDHLVEVVDHLRQLKETS
jgi:cysteine desulfurase